MLEACPYCEKRISEAAEYCPSCGQHSPFGVECPYCDHLVLKGQGLSLDYRQCHITCWDRYFRTPVAQEWTCAACHAAIRLDPQTVRSRPACAVCGHPNRLNVFAECADCGFPICPELGHRAMEVGERWHRRSGDDDGVDVEQLYAHHFCRRGRHAKDEAGSAARADRSFRRLLYAMMLASVGVFVMSVVMEWYFALGLSALAALWLGVVLLDS